MGAQADKMTLMDDERFKLLFELREFYYELQTRLSDQLASLPTNDCECALEKFYLENFREDEQKWSPKNTWITLFRLCGLDSAQAMDQMLLERGLEIREIADCMLDLNDWEQKLEQTLRDIDERLNVHFGHFEPLYIDGSKISVRDAATCEPSTLDEFYKNTNYTLFIMMHYFGSPTCITHIKDVLDHQTQFASHNCAVCIVCFGSEQGASEWLCRTEITQFPLLIDENGEFVKAGQFPRSVWNSVRISYQKQTAAYLSTMPDGLNPLVFNDEKHDVHQLGGDIVVDTNGRIVYRFISKTYEDRPRACDIIKQLKD